MSCVQDGGHQARDITKRYNSLTEQGQGLADRSARHVGSGPTFPIHACNRIGEEIELVKGQVDDDA
jgi:hypothetical protein